MEILPHISKKDALEALTQVKGDIEKATLMLLEKFPPPSDEDEDEDEGEDDDRSLLTTSSGSINFNYDDRRQLFSSSGTPSLLSHLILLILLKEALSRSMMKRIS